MVSKTPTPDVQLVLLHRAGSLSIRGHLSEEKVMCGYQVLTAVLKDKDNNHVYLQFPSSGTESANSRPPKKVCHGCITSINSIIHTMSGSRAPPTHRVQHYLCSNILQHVREKFMSVIDYYYHYY